MQCNIHPCAGAPPANERSELYTDLTNSHIGGRVGGRLPWQRRDDDSAALVNRRGNACTDEALSHREKLRHASDGSEPPSLAMALRALVRHTTKVKPKAALQ
jgi:hypothetical protein